MSVYTAQLIYTHLLWRSRGRKYKKKHVNNAFDKPFLLESPSHLYEFFVPNLTFCSIITDFSANTPYSFIQKVRKKSSIEYCIRSNPQNKMPWNHSTENFVVRPCMNGVDSNNNNCNEIREEFSVFEGSVRTLFSALK